MPDYSKAVIYTIRSGDGLYVGSTCNYTKRKYDHKHKISNSNTNLYNTIRANNGEWEMKPHSEFPCENKIQLIIEEERVRREMNADLNMLKCRRTKEDNNISNSNYRNKNKEKINGYYKEKKEEILIKNKIKGKCECGCIVRIQGLPEHRRTDKHIKLMDIKS